MPTSGPYTPFEKLSQRNEGARREQSHMRCSESWGQPPSPPPPPQRSCRLGVPGGVCGGGGAVPSREPTFEFFKVPFWKIIGSQEPIYTGLTSPQGEEFKGDPTRLLSHSVSTRGTLVPAKVPSANSCVCPRADAAATLEDAELRDGSEQLSSQVPL